MLFSRILWTVYTTQGRKKGSPQTFCFLLQVFISLRTLVQSIEIATWMNDTGSKHTTAEPIRLSVTQALDCDICMKLPVRPFQTRVSRPGFQDFLIPLRTGLIWLSRELPGVRISSLCFTCLSHTPPSLSPQSWHGFNKAFNHPLETRVLTVGSEGCRLCCSPFTHSPFIWNVPKA